MRRPVKLPGPESASSPSRSPGFFPASSSTSRISWSSRVELRSTTSSRAASWRRSSPRSPRATLTRGEAESIASRSMGRASIGGDRPGRGFVGRPLYFPAVSAPPASAPPATIATNLTPMLRQYLEIKAVHPEEILLYRMGDFFELFYDDAVRAAPILEVQLTARNRGTGNEAPMCGVPHHAIESYIAKLLAAGLRVAICDQVEDPAQAKGLVRREVTRIVTPGTISSPGLLPGNEDNYLASITWAGERGAAAFLDVSTGAFFIRRFASEEEAVEQLATLAPREALFEEGTLPRAILDQLERECPCRTPLGGDRRFDPRRAAELLTRHFGTAGLRGFGLEEGE